MNDPNPVELGLKFQSLAAGNIVGLRFYKGPQNSGTYVGNLWDSSGNNLATVTFTGEMASGWQTASFPSPVAIQAGKTYVVSYHTNGFYSADKNYFASAFTNRPLTGLASGSSGGNGVYLYGAGGFPTNTFQATNYWVDVLLQSHDTVPPLTVITSPVAGASLIQGAQVQITGTATDAAGFVGGIEVSVDGGTKWHPAQPASGSLGLENWTYAWTPTTIGAATIMARAVDDSLNQESPGASAKVTVVASSTQSLWPNDPTPATATVNDPNAVELGVKFQSSQAGKILGIRFYKGPQNTGTHIGTLWDASGNQLSLG